MQSKYNHRAIKNKAASLVALCDGPAYVDLLQSRIERATSTTLCKGALAPARGAARYYPRPQGRTRHSPVPVGQSATDAHPRAFVTNLLRV